MVILLLAEVGVFLAVWAYRRWVLAGGLLDDAKSDALGEHLVHRSSGRRLPFTAARHLGRRSDATFPVSFHRASLSRPRAAPPSGAAGRPPPLDGDWRVVTPFPERVNAALTTVTRERLAALFAEPVQAVRAARDRVWIEVDPGRRGLTDVELAPALAAAVELHRLLLQARPAGSAWTGNPWRRSPAALAAAHPAFLAAGTVGPFLAWVLMPAVEVASHAEIAAAGLKGALVAALAWLALLTWRTRGRSGRAARSGASRRRGPSGSSSAARRSPSRSTRSSIARRRGWSRWRCSRPVATSGAGLATGGARGRSCTS